MSAYACLHCACSCGACELPDSTCRTRDVESRIAELEQRLREANDRGATLWLELVDLRERLRKVTLAVAPLQEHR